MRGFQRKDGEIYCEDETGKLHNPWSEEEEDSKHYMRSEVKLHTFITLALGGGEQPASQSTCLNTLGENAPSTCRTRN